jgi:hypothetical protein
MPKRCVVPQTMSASHSPGGTSSVSASRSAATMSAASHWCAWPASGRRSCTWPVVAGYCASTPKNSPLTIRCGSVSDTVLTFTSMPSGAARVLMTSMVCGWQSPDTRNTLLLLLTLRLASVMASAAAVASSSIEALAMAMPVRSHTIVWKLSRASMRPCEISAW